MMLKWPEKSLENLKTIERFNYRESLGLTHHYCIQNVQHRIQTRV